MFLKFEDGSAYTPRPEDSETLDKLDRDARKERFIDKYGQLFGVELDALLQIFDKHIYEKEQAKHSAEEIRRLIHNTVRFLDDPEGEGGGRT